MGGWNGSGNVTLTYDWTDDRDAGTPITASRVEANEQDLVSAIEATVNINGETTMAANLPMGTNKLTGLGDGTALTDSVSFKQLQNSAGQYAVDSGAADAYVISLSPAPSAYATGMTIKVKISATNTGASTINANALGAKAIKKADGVTDLAAGDLQANQIYILTYDGTNFQVTGALDANIAIRAYRPLTNETAVQTFALADSNSLQRLTGSTSRVWTIPANSAVAFATGTEIEVFNDGTATLTLTADTGVVINGVTAGSIALVANQGGVLKKVDTDRWIYMGDNKENWA